jgi:hypothetical protein
MRSTQDLNNERLPDSQTRVRLRKTRKQTKIYIMKSSKLLLSALLLVTSQLLPGQQIKNQWEKWNYLVGEWVGEGNGQPGQGEGKFSFLTDLDGNIMIRKSHTVFPATVNSKEIIHDDLMIIYQAGSDGSQEAIYFDNEGHTIKYKVSYTEKSIVLTSSISANETRFRYTYTMIDPKTVNSSFEMASPKTPEEFKMYLSGKSIKVK